VRIVSATNRDLELMREKGTFRLDVIERLAALEIHLPALRDRQGDLKRLVPILLERLAYKAKVSPKRLTERAEDKLARHDWPGNIRELANVLRGALVFSKRPFIDADDLEIRGKFVTRSEDDTGVEATPDDWLAFVTILRASFGRDEVLEKLDISKATFQRRLSWFKRFDPEKRLLP